jgi:signal transduction histidine kinase
MSAPGGRWLAAHSAVLVLLGLHLPVLAAIALLAGHGIGPAAAGAVMVAAPAAGAALPVLRPRLRAALAGAGLAACSIVALQLAPGSAWAGFHALIVLAVLAVYADWIPVVVAACLLGGSLAALTPAVPGPGGWFAAHLAAVVAMTGVTLVLGRLSRPAGEPSAAGPDREEARLRAELLNAVSHELRGPLTTIMGFSEVLLDDDGRLSGPQRFTFVTRIASQARRLERLATGILAAAEPGRDDEPAHTHLSRSLQLLVGDVVDPEEVERVTVGGAEPGLCVALPYRALRLLVGSLVDDALALVRPGGRVELSIAGDGEGLTGPVVLACRFERDLVVEPDDPGLTGHAAADGSGLALATRIARAHGGDVRVEEIGPRVEITLELPSAAHAPAPIPVAVPNGG